MHEHRRGCAAITAFAALLLLVTIGVKSRPYLFPADYLATVERNAAPLVAAIERFEVANARPPRELGELVPEYLAAIPRSGYPPQERFLYGVYHREGGTQWDLYVFCSLLDFAEPDEMCYSSETREWRYRP